ncbi:MULTISPECIES: hypothetical protein [unclassified Oceanobacter]|uniref:DUF6976 family protein n=1 Tax=unclassified Oceanobacter TaxID=2620260 RepID=UPI00273630A5|nr:MULTISPECIES: hypothetical protein [unclassified Oceanobacter]MDP2607619.1 hypothetical protein [Oceanobacter sp. 1_MG-2023]MDP2610887.1 hypothetical protein [Oceanobacter sp. 2_MG-2023]
MNLAISNHPDSRPGSGNVPGHLMTVAAAARIIQSGRGVSIAGDEAALRQLPKGFWIGGTIPYFMSEDGGLCSRELVFVNELPAASGAPDLCTYDERSIEGVCNDAPDNGFTVLIVPAFSEVHQRFAKNAPEFDNMYLQPLVGWVAGIHLDDLSSDKVSPKVVFGPTGEFHDNLAVAMHVAIDGDKAAGIEIINLFQPGNGPVIRFPESGLSATEVDIDGVSTNLANYLHSSGADTRLPLVADYCGAYINVSFQNVNATTGEVTFYAPVYAGQAYRLAGAIPPYAEAFAQQVPHDDGEIAFCCNCILNYLYGELEGKKTDRMHGPITFGEIAYQLVNQTMVYLRVS